MALFRFRAISRHTHEQLPFELFIAAHSAGFAPTAKDEFLDIEVDTVDKPVTWYAMIWNARVAKGGSMGGTIPWMSMRSGISLNCTAMPPMVDGRPVAVRQL